ncbi:hypothetical protein [Collinsella intestinalis]|uniref:hypothetical protein n=1 Tax=Collinsella intestinalis TaxID=147207 RepID=UPI0025A33FB0|nr:hypothetical protein [Collinsella intestinalis]MDM8162418.1 hypothetical protein [Collinsella intestinalis]
MAILRFKYVEDAPADGQAVQPVHIDGLPSGGSTPGNASTATAGVVKMATAVANVAAADATSTASSETVAPSEFSAAVTLLNECKTKLNALLAAERTAGQLSS